MQQVVISSMIWPFPLPNHFSQRRFRFFLSLFVLLFLALSLSVLLSCTLVPTSLLSCSHCLHLSVSSTPIFLCLLSFLTRCFPNSISCFRHFSRSVMRREWSLCDHINTREQNLKNINSNDFAVFGCNSFQTSSSLSIFTLCPHRNPHFHISFNSTDYYCWINRIFLILSISCSVRFFVFFFGKMLQSFWF